MPALAVGVAAVAVVGAALALSGRFPAVSPATETAAPGTAGASNATDILEPLTLAGIQRRPHLVFQNVIRHDDYAAVSLVPLDAPGGARLTTDLVCERVHVAAGAGVCMAGQHEEESGYFAVVFGDDFRAGARIPLDGSPSYGRVAPDGHRAAVTVQTRPSTPEAPLAPLRTLLIDMAAGRLLGDLGEFRVTRNGVPIDDPEMDVWGVTFAPGGSRFFASLRTAGNTYLVEGDLEREAMDVRATNVSAPSLSPDGTRLAYAKLVSNIGPTWRFHVLDLATMTETPLAEARSIDEQPEWLDGETILYGLSTDIWSVPADGTGAPGPFLFGGLSPAVVR